MYLIRTHRKKLVALLMASSMIILFVFLSTDEEPEDTTTTPQDVEVINLNTYDRGRFELPVYGRVESDRRASLSSQLSGTVRRVNISMGDRVVAGQTLVSLDHDDASFQLQQAEAALDVQIARLREMESGSRPEQLNIRESALESARTSLDETRRQTEEAIENAREALLNNDLRAYLADESTFVSDAYSIDPPTISGTYTGEEGQYRIQLYRSFTQSGYSFRYSGPEGRGSGSVNTRVPQPLGENGLYILFPENFANAFNIEWVVPIPNTRGTGYVSVLNAYQRALNERDARVRQAEEAVKQRESELQLESSGSRPEQIEAQRAQIRQSEASLNAARSQLSKRAIQAPFSGRISSVSINTGENVSPGQELMFIEQEGTEKYVQAYIAPRQARMVSVGDEVSFSTGARGTIRAVAFGTSDQTGQVAIEIGVGSIPEMPGEYLDADILIDSRSDDIFLPLSAIEITSEGHSVLTVRGGVVERVFVSVGSIEGSYVSVRSGLGGLSSIVENVSMVVPGQKVTEIR